VSGRRKDSQRKEEVRSFLRSGKRKKKREGELVACEEKDHAPQLIGGGNRVNSEKTEPGESAVAAGAQREEKEKNTLTVFAIIKRAVVTTPM